MPWDDVLDFWFGVLGPDGLPSLDVRKRWFAGGPHGDAAIRSQFGDDVAAALRGEREEWAASPRGRVALVVLLDQFTRSIHRGRPDAFAGDPKALAQTDAAVASEEDEELRAIEQYFLYMPFEHAEDARMQERSVALFQRLLDDAPAEARGVFQGGLDYARRHQAVIERFGRFPARNAALGRASTPEEAAYLEEHPSGF